jgi:hypothetical protein
VACVDTWLPLKENQIKAITNALCQNGQTSIQIKEHLDNIRGDMLVAPLDAINPSIWTVGAFFPVRTYGTLEYRHIIETHCWLRIPTLNGSVFHRHTVRMKSNNDNQKWMMDNFALYYNKQIIDTLLAIRASHQNESKGDTSGDVRQITAGIADMGH